MPAGRNDAEFQLFVAKLAAQISDQLDQGVPQTSITDELIRKGFPQDNVQELVNLTVSKRWLTSKEMLIPTIVSHWEERANKRAADKQKGGRRMRWGILLVLGGALIGLSMSFSSTDPNPIIPFFFFGALIVGTIYIVLGLVNRFLSG